MEIYRSEFIVINYFSEKKYTELIWLPASEDMNDEQYKQEMLAFYENVIELERIGGITDKRECHFSVHPDLQEWLNTNLMVQFIEKGQNKLAVVESTDLIINLASQQTMEEEVGLKFETKYFDNIEAATKWIESFSQHS